MRKCKANMHQSATLRGCDVRGAKPSVQRPALRAIVNLLSACAEKCNTIVPRHEALESLLDSFSTLLSPCLCWMCSTSNHLVLDWLNDWTDCMIDTDWLNWKCLTLIEWWIESRHWGKWICKRNGKQCLKCKHYWTNCTLIVQSMHSLQVQPSLKC